ncbi:hypothetical protein AZE42_01330, partial [Rhizopogon vesiculosus]
MSWLCKLRRSQRKHEDDDPLCSTCSTLDLHAILKDGIPREHAVPLGHLTDILNKHDQCGLCRLMATLIRRLWQLDKHPGVDLGGITCAMYAEACGTVLDNTSPKDICHQLYIQWSTRPRDVYIAMSAAQSPLTLEIRLLEEDASKVGRTKELHGRRVDQIVDISMLKKWIRTCENKHREKCKTVWWRGDDVLPSTVRVVDVARMAIVPAPPTCRYVALSYVWGGPGDGYWTTQANLAQRSIPGGLDASVMPGTISDTIQLVRQLGERYLWIDALCIVQDDPDDKEVQICAMELIYGSSAFTIIAVGCTSARDPLPGIRPGTRDPKQQIAKIQGLHLAIPLPVPNETIASSVWNERGWTFQEVMLSQRRIFFTAYQVYFECTKDVWSEDIVAEPINHTWTAHPLKGHGMSQLTLTSAPVYWMSDTYLDRYMTVAREYTQRKLTVESDIVDAVAALLTALRKGFKVDDGFRFGMPLRGLERSLLWQPTANAPNSRRVPANEMRVPWPSWSWAAWRGAAKYASIGVFVDIQMGTEGAGAFVEQSLVEQWYIVNEDGQPVHQYVPRQPGELSEDINRKTYVRPKGDIDPQQLITGNAPLLPGTLIFRTSYSRFDVTKADDVAGAGAGIVANHAIYSILSDTPQPSTLVGRIILPCSTHSPT